MEVDKDSFVPSHMVIKGQAKLFLPIDTIRDLKDVYGIDCVYEIAHVVQNDLENLGEYFTEEEFKILISYMYEAAKNGFVKNNNSMV